jgi:uncharacterized protein
MPVRAAASLLGMLVAVLVVPACSAPAPPRIDTLVIATGGRGGVYYTLGDALANAARERWSAKVEVQVTAASVENLRLVAEGRADLGFTTLDSAALAQDGATPFGGSLEVVALAGLYDDYLQIVVPAAGNIRTVADLRGRRVSTGSAGSGTEIVAARILDTAGIDAERDIVRKRLSASTSAEALRAGEIDAFFFTGGLPTPAVADLAKQVPIRLLSVADEVVRLQQRYGDFYVARSIPATVYGLDDEVATLGIPNVLVVRRTMSDEIAYQLTSLLFESKAQLAAAHEEARRLDARSALATFPIELHPGAARYYRKTKPMIG